MFLPALRVLKFSFQDIFRNIWLSLVTIIILVLALFTVNMILVVKIVGDTAVGAVKEKIDINIFLETDAEENEILELKAKLLGLNEVKEVEYISKEQALQSFKDKHVENIQILDALKELGKNPLAPSLIIKPKDLNDFDNLVNQINLLDNDIIKSRNFANYKLIIDKINSITDKVSRAGISLSLIFIFITILVIYNSVRVAIYTHKREIKIMRLVGASNNFIVMPYLISSIIYTLFGILIMMAIFLPFLSLLQPYLETFVEYDVNLFTYYTSNLLMIFGLQFLAGALINVVASFLAVRKYSNV